MLLMKAKSVLRLEPLRVVKSLPLLNKNQETVLWLWSFITHFLSRDYTLKPLLNDQNMYPSDFLQTVWYMQRRWFPFQSLMYQGLIQWTKYFIKSQYLNPHDVGTWKDQPNKSSPPSLYDYLPVFWTINMSLKINVYQIIWCKAPIMLQWNKRIFTYYHCIFIIIMPYYVYKYWWVLFLVYQHWWVEANFMCEVVWMNVYTLCLWLMQLKALKHTG